MEKQQIIKVIEFLSSCFTLPFLYAIRYYFYKRFLGFKYKPWKFILSALFLTFIYFFTIEIASESLKIIICDGIWLAIICFLCKGNFLIKFYTVIVEEVILLLISITFITFDFYILPMTHNINMSFDKHMVISFINNTFGDFISFTILFIFLKILCSLLNLKEKSINLYQSLYLLIPTLSIYSLAVIFYLIQSIRIDEKKYYLIYIFPKLYYVIPFVSFALLISILITAYTFKKMLDGEQEQKKSMLMEQQFKLQLNHTKNLERLYNGIRSIKHDLNNHIDCLRNLASANNIEEIKKYLSNISKTISKIDFQIKTGNPIADAVINEKYNNAKSEGIEFICDFILPKEISVEPIDLCVILSNSLDNSIEACMRISDCSIPKTIWIKSYIREIYLIIEVSNTTIDKLQYVKNQIISTKSDSYNHGMGISNIKSAIRKYNGVIDIMEEKNKFILNLMFRINT